MECQGTLWLNCRWTDADNAVAAAAAAAADGDDDDDDDDVSVWFR